MVSSAFPGRPFNLRENVWLIEQDIAGNQSKLGWQLWIDKTAYSPTFSGGAANRSFYLDGVLRGSISATGFDFRGSGPWLILSGETWLAHEANGTKSFDIYAPATYDLLGSTSVTVNDVGLPTIPRASTGRFDPSSTITAGTAVTIHTDWASSSFTHDITYTFGSASGTVATGVGGSTSWTPPLSLLTQIPNTTSGSGTITVVTKSGATTIGTKTTPFTLQAGAGVVPTISSLTVSDDNPTVVSQVGLFVQDLSILKATVNASGVQGSTITGRSWGMPGAQSIASGSGAKVTASGTVPLSAWAGDSRGRSAAWSGNVTVLPYLSPLFTNVLVRRCDAGGAVNDNGISLRVDLNCAVQSLMNSTQRNSLTIKVFTRPYGGSTWTARNVINVTAGTVTYNSNFVVSGGANYPIDDSFDVRVEVADKFNTAAAQTVVATAAVFMHWSKTGVGFGKFHENGTVDVAGDVYATGEVRTRGNGIVAPVGVVCEFAGSTAPTGWLLCQGQAVSRTTYADLFATIGTTYGAGNGSSTFNVPDKKGRVGVGLDSAQTEFDTLGETGGSKTHTLTAQELPDHSHVWPGGTAAAAGTGDIFSRAGTGGQDGSFRTGSGIAASGAYGAAQITGSRGHNNLQPFLVMNFIIKV
ncbi:DUF859 family phage minor structural protein [Microbacterium allomyrinae]|uniref:Tail fiber protein n=1 Tax=Microbacterium allomyrinae TaxID=2830666 RepID=A0A9X1LWE6_9MICO|nr:DUF859 family phage minor structural protein [Microbacterium allomyrinae]MCC2033061.1 tail fiber protein [Microbacterium allomyrinae]